MVIFYGCNPFFILTIGGVIIIRYDFMQQPKPQKNQDDLVNELIRFPEVLVISPDGESLGVKTRNEALKIAKEHNLDLLCVAPMAKPPVCKILNYGKHRFEQQKKSREIRKNQKVVEVKEVRMTPLTDVHDMNTKVKAARKWIEAGNKVKVTVRYRGRQMAHIEVGEETMNRFLELMGENIIIEKKPALDGRQLIAVIAPKSGK
jgi:translation initiation factor IF-3